VDEGFIRREHRQWLLSSADAQALLKSLLLRPTPSHLPKWLDADQR
jgi:hypothetical protein